jgi:uncharacterized protein YlxW (UPF0749 family)
MTDAELPPPQRHETDDAVPDVAEPGRVAIERQGTDGERNPRPPAAREPDGGTPEGPGAVEGIERSSETIETIGGESSAPRAETIQQPVETIEQPVETIEQPVETIEQPVETIEQPVETIEQPVVTPAASAEPIEPTSEAIETEPPAPKPMLPPGDPEPLPSRAVARGRLGRAMRPRATRAQLLAGALCALLGFALVVQARQTQTQGLDSLRQADLVRLLDNVTNAEARAEQDVRDEQAIRDRLRSGTGSSAAAQEAAQKRLDTLGLLAGTVGASGPGIVLEITDPRRQVDAATLLDTVEELRDGGAEVIQIGSVRVVAATAFTDEADGVQVDDRVLTPPYTIKVIGEPQTLARLLQIPGGVLDVLHSKGAQGKVTQPTTVTIEALRSPTRPQYARPAPGATP